MVATVIRRLLVLGILSTLRPVGAAAESPAPEINARLAQLQASDMDARLSALRELSTSLDPRLPEAMLKLLGDEGNSTRRMAARGIGSRWWQIPQGRLPDYIAALRRNDTSEHEDERNMVARALGLLRRDYAGPMFGRSASGRWVIYERRGHPCLIDTENGSEELFGWNGEEYSGWLSGAIGNSTLEENIAWHPRRDIVGLDIYMGRRESAIWVWEHGQGLQVIAWKDVEDLLDITAGKVHGLGGRFMELEGWKGVKEDELHIEVYYTLQMSEGDFVDWKAIVAWKTADRKLRLVSNAKSE